MADNENMGNKANVLLLGGVGFIGRNIVHYLTSNNLVNKLVVVDKVMPLMAWLNPMHKEAFSKVEFKHANLINPNSVSSVFENADGSRFDYVINCAAETKLGQSDAVYRDGIFKLSCNCAAEAAKHGVQRYIELSTAHMLPSDKKPVTEECTQLEPWTQLALQKLEVERELHSMTNLDYIIVRPAIVYGPGDRTGLTPRLVLGGVYKHLNETMQLLWNKDYKMNTVHVFDVARAVWHLCRHGARGEVYNLADNGDTTQGMIGEIISRIFDVEINYLGFIASNAAKLNVEEVVEDINEKHMTPWGEACLGADILNTPLTPYLEKELLLNKQLCVDGRKIESIGFQYERPRMTEQLLRQFLSATECYSISAMQNLNTVLDDYLAMGLYPLSLVHT